MENHVFDKKDFALFWDLTITMMSDTKAVFLMMMAEKYGLDDEVFNKKQEELNNLSNNIRVKIIEKIYEEHGDLPNEIKDILK